MKKKDLLNLWNGLHQVGDLQGVKFAYAVSKNINLIKPEMEALNSSLLPSKEYIDYDKERLELAKKHSKKDEKGNPKTLDKGSRFDLEDETAFNKDFEALKDKFKTVVENREKQIKEYNELLESEIQLVLFKVKMSEVPVNITPAQLEPLMVIIEE